MKEDWNLTYKRWLSRPNIVDFDRIKALIWMFSVQFSLNLKPNTLIWNLYEWSFSRSTKINYLWSTRGKNKEVHNAPFVGSIYMILTILSNILSNEWWIWLITNHTINSNIFIDYLKILKKWIDVNKWFGYKE